MTILNIPIIQLQSFFLIFLRVCTILLMMPLFDSKSIPSIFKIGLAFSVSILLFPVIKINTTPFLMDVLPFGLGVISEIVLGLSIGLSIRLIFAGIQLAGQLAGFQMGFAIVNVMDTFSSAQISIISQFNNLIAMLVFLVINAHHWLLRALVESFRIIPPFHFHFNSSMANHMIKLSGNMFIIAVQVAAPVIVALLLTSVALGLIARTVPQMNVFIVAFPLKIIVGILFMAFSLPYLISFLKQLFLVMGNNIIVLLKTI